MFARWVAATSDYNDAQRDGDRRRRPRSAARSKGRSLNLEDPAVRAKMVAAA